VGNKAIRFEESTLDLLSAPLCDNLKVISFPATTQREISHSVRIWRKKQKQIARKEKIFGGALCKIVRFCDTFDVSLDREVSK
jgi:hypothetical protein